MAGEHEQAEMSEFEQALRTLAPAATRMDRDRLMFLAGRASAHAAGPSSTSPELSAAGAVPRRPGNSHGLPPAARRSASRWLWPATTFVSTTCAAILGVLLLLRPGTPAADVHNLAGDGSAVREPLPAPRDGARPAPSLTARTPIDPELASEPRITVPEQSSVGHTTERQTAFGFGIQELDPEQFPVYLRLRHLVLEQGVEALSPPRAGEAIAHVHPPRSRTLRAIDRPGRADAESGDWTPGTFPAGDDQL